MLSKNEVARLKSLRGRLAVLCPETDGLQAKHRIKRVLKGKARQERVEELLDIVASEILTFDHFYKDAKLASLIFRKITGCSVARRARSCRLNSSRS